MSGLVRKELREWGPPGAALLLLLCLGWCLLGSAADVLLEPRPEWTLVVLATASLLGLALGYAQLVRERARGTLAYLAHREGGRRALLSGKLAVGIPLALALGMLPPLALLLQESFGPLAGVIQPQRAIEHALAGCVALPAYAVGLLIAQLAPAGFSTFAQGLLACVGCSLYSLWLPLPVWRGSDWSIPLFVLGELALAAAVLALARGLFLRSHDRDVVLPVRLQSGTALVGLLLLVYPSWWAFTYSIGEGQRSLFECYPLVVHHADGRYAEMERSEFYLQASSGAHRTTFTLPDGTVAGEPDPALAYSPWAPPDLPEEFRNRLAAGERGGLKDTQRWQTLEFEPTPGVETRTYFDRETGTVRQFRDLPSARAGADELSQARRPRARSLARPDGKAFSRETIVLLAQIPMPLLVDRSDGTLWVLANGATDTRLAELSLPDGDRLVELRAESGWYPEGWQGNEPIRVVLVGAQGRYEWTARGFQPAGSPATLPWRQHRCRSEVGETSLTALTVRLREPDESGRVGSGSAVVFEQRYEPSSPEQIGRAALMRAGLLCGPPALSAQRLLFDSSRPLLGGLLSPARMPRDLAGVHLLHMLLGATLGLLTWRHLARRGATRSECLLWSVLAALFGVFVLAFLLMLAPRPAPALQAAPKESKPSEPAASMAAM